MRSKLRQRLDIAGLFIAGLFALVGGLTYSIGGPYDMAIGLIGFGLMLWLIAIGCVVHASRRLPTRRHNEGLTPFAPKLPKQ